MRERVTPDLAAWMRVLEARHMADLQFKEVTRALRALSSTYVERREGLPSGAALSGHGKRAAFALFYGPLHYLLVRAIVERIPGAAHVKGPIVDLGCGTGSAGAAWASSCRPPIAVAGVDRHPWAVAEANQTYREMGLAGRARGGDLTRDPLPRGAAYLAAFTLNELPPAARASVLAALLDRAAAGSAVLVVEPLARSAAPWWQTAAAPFLAAGAREDEWRIAVERPPLVAKLDKAAGLDHREVSGRTLWLRR